MPALIEITDLSYRPASLPAERLDILRNINLKIERGSFVALIGPNGSGKTTLIKLINALLIPTHGSVKVNELDTQNAVDRQKLRGLVGMVFQNPADQIVASTVAEDVAFGLENANLPTETIRQRVAEQLAVVDLTAESGRPPHLLSGGQIQKLALAGVLARQPEILLFDEPTSMLDPVSRKDFLRQIQALHHQGMTVIYVTHHMEETVFADQIVVLKDGQICMQGSPGEIFTEKDKLHEAGLDIPKALSLADQFRLLGWKLPSNILTPKELIDSLPVYRGPNVQSLPLIYPEQEDPIVSIQDVHYTYLAHTPLAKNALNGATINISPRKIHGIAGSNGSGKSTLLQHINGILRPSQGRVRVGSFQLEKADTFLKDIIQKVGLVFQSPETQFFEVFVGDEVAYGPKQFNLQDIRQRVQEALTLVGLDFDAYKDRRLETLSGGEKRKVAIASTLILDQDILLLDEPTAGMDPQSKEDLLTLFTQLCAQDKTIVIASHRMDELAETTQNLSLMRAGMVTRTAATNRVMSEPNKLVQSGLEPPLSVRVSQNLMDKGWPIAGKDTTTPDRLFQVLREVAQ